EETDAPPAAPRSPVRPVKGRASVPAWADVLLGTTARERTPEPPTPDEQS
ncbi:MAG: hypothetical protein JWL64_2040, partial [Frankiales bacterium]|nr:hypothetical protein [Frankiales bacterium]